MSAHKIAELRNPARKLAVPCFNIAKRDIPKCSNRYYPNHHAVWAKCMDAVHRLKKEPVHKGQAENSAGFQPEPKPAFGNSDAGEQHRTDAYEHRERHQADPWVGESEGVRLFGLHDRTAADDGVEIAVGTERGVLQQFELVERDNKRADEANNAANNEYPRQHLLE